MKEDEQKACALAKKISRDSEDEFLSDFSAEEFEGEGVEEEQAL